MIKRIEIIIKGEEAYNPETLRSINKGDFGVEIVSAPPVPILSRQDPISGNISSGGFVIGYRPSPEPPKIYLVIGEGIGEARLRKTARDLLDYRDKYGALEFRRRFGIKDIKDEDFLEFLRVYLEEGDLPSREEDLAGHG